MGREENLQVPLCRRSLGCSGLGLGWVGTMLTFTMVKGGKANQKAEEGEVDRMESNSGSIIALPMKVIN